MSKKEILIRTHRKKLVELTYLALLGRPAEDLALEPHVDTIRRQAFNLFVSSIKGSKEFFEKHLSDPQKTDVFFNEPAPLISSKKLPTRKQMSDFSKNKNSQYKDIHDFLRKTYPTAASDYMQQIRKVTKDF